MMIRKLVATVANCLSKAALRNSQTGTKVSVWAMDRPKSLVSRKITNHKVMIFSKSFCPFCIAAKDLFQELNLKPGTYEVMELDEHEGCFEIQDHLHELTGARSVPRIFIDGNCIGGFDEAQDLHRSGKLRDLLRTANVL